MTLDELRERTGLVGADQFISVPAGDLLRLLDEHKLMRETLEKIRVEYSQVGGIPLCIPDYLAAEALAKVSK